ALPGKKKGTILLEDHALALVPHGPFLLERLREPARGNGPGALLALGGVAYDQAAVPLERKGAAPAAHAPAPAGRKLRSDALAGRKRRGEALGGSAAEMDAVLDMARGHSPAPKRMPLPGREAGTPQFPPALPAARWVHLATHGFFAAPESKVRKELVDDRLF